MTSMSGRYHHHRRPRHGSTRTATATTTRARVEETGRRLLLVSLLLSTLVVGSNGQVRGQQPRQLQPEQKQKSDKELQQQSPQNPSQQLNSHLRSLVSYIDPEPYTIVGSIPSGLRLSETADYKCTFHNEWSSLRHPRLYPGDSAAYWSAPIIASHNKGYRMWSEGELATTAIEGVAEKGDNGLLRSELDRAHLLYVNDHVEGSDQYNIQKVQSQTLPVIQVTNFHPLLSSISMIACSPDWFSGFYNLDMRSHTTNTWYKTVQIQVYPFDAGTENGDDYKCVNSATVPQEPITQLSIDTIPSMFTTGVFLNQEATTVLPVGEWTCNLQNEPECNILGKPCVTGLECCSEICLPLSTPNPTPTPTASEFPTLYPSTSNYPTTSVYPTNVSPTLSPSDEPTIAASPSKTPTVPGLIPGICA